MEFLAPVSQFILAHNSALLMIAGTAFAVAKRFSTEKAPKYVGLVQAIFDKAAKGLVACGNFVQELADFLAQVLKSDGVLGKK